MNAATVASTHTRRGERMSIPKESQAEDVERLAPDDTDAPCCRIPKAR
jgi:hypothetical protein